MIKRIIAAVSLALAAFTPAASAAIVGPSYYNAPILDADCTSTSCWTHFYTGVDYIWGVSYKNITMPVGAKIFGCDKWGVTNGAHLGDKGVIAKLIAPHSKIKTASGSSYAGLFMNPVAYGSTDPDQPDYMRCRTYQDK